MKPWHALNIEEMQKTLIENPINYGLNRLED